MRLALSLLPSSAAARTRPSCALSWGLASAAQAFSISGSGFVGLALQRLDGGGADLVVFGEQLERGQRGVELAAHAVVVDDVLGASGTGTSAPVTGSKPLSSRTMNALHQPP
jgi:hypothetical protein